MDILTLINDKTLKSKDKREQLAHWILDSCVEISALIEFANGSKDVVKATCMEALEHATKIKPAIADAVCLDFAVQSLRDKAS